MADSTWTEGTLKMYLGREESMRLEFKSGRLMDGNPDKVAENLSKEISAFANTEGGLLFLGIAEEDRIATRLDGISEETWPSYRLQQLIESNIYPPLAGIRVYRVPLTEFSGSRVVFVIEVPQGRTAHQAKDCRYYGRSEFETKALRDFDIRLRMERGKAAHAEISSSVRLVRSASTLLAEQIEEHRRNLIELRDIAEAQGKDIERGSLLNKLGVDKPHLIDPGHLSDRYRCSEYEVEFFIINAGETTLRDFEIHIDVTCVEGFGVGPPKAQPSGGFFDLDNIAHLNKTEIHGTLRDFITKNTRPVLKVWPGGKCSLGRLYLFVPENIHVPSGAIMAKWKVFMDDVFPRSGEVDLGMQTAGIDNASTHAG